MTQWTNEPPTEPGYYWVRERITEAQGWGEPDIARCLNAGVWRLLTGDRPAYDVGARTWRQFWPERIEPPPDGERALREIADMVQARCDELNGDPPKG
jgi:hypothetical protein